MLADCSYYYNKENKWKHQIYHKKCNNMQYASKHYGTSELIQKRKNPVKQRKDRKKFKVQRNRKKIYKRMVFDYDDFLNKNKKENYKRIQTRPTVSYYCQYKKQIDIELAFSSYYYNENHQQQTETLQNNIPIWQCNLCTYINIEKLEFCYMCNNPFKYKYDYDHNGFDNDRFYSVKYVTAKNKSNKKHFRSKKRSKNKSNNNDFATYWNEMTKSQSKYEEMKTKVKRKLKTCKNDLIIVLSINNRKNAFLLNYKFQSNPSLYARIDHKDELYFEPIIIAKIKHYYPFYEIPICFEPKMYQDLLKHNKIFQYELSIIIRKLKQQFQPQVLKTNDVLEEMINKYKTSLKIVVEKSTMNINATQNVAKTDEQTNSNKHTTFVELVLMYKAIGAASTNLRTCYQYMNNTFDVAEIKQEMFYLKEINLKAYNEKSFSDVKIENDIAELAAAKQTNILFDMFQDESDDEFSEEQMMLSRRKNKNNNSYQFKFTNEYDRTVDICSTLGTFSPFTFYDSFYQQFNFKNDTILNIAKQCVNTIFEKCDDCQFKFDEKHIPHHNLLPLLFRISRILYQYLPSMDIINNICVPMIGYDKMYYVSINTQIKSSQTNKFVEIKNDYDDVIQEQKHAPNAPDDHDIAASYSALYYQLIMMGFDAQSSLEAAKKYSNNINSAIDWIRNSAAYTYTRDLERRKKKKNVLYEEEEESSISSYNNGCRCCGGVGLFGCSCNDSSSSDNSSDSD